MRCQCGDFELADHHHTVDIDGGSHAAGLCIAYPAPDPGPGVLTVAEIEWVSDLGNMWDRLAQIVEPGPTAAADLAELAAHIHALQHAVMANAAARAYPEAFRPLGASS